MKVDQLIKNVNVYNTFTQSFEHGNVYVLDGKFYHLKLEEDLESDLIIDGKNKYMIPGLIDIHMHIESSMTIPSEFSKAVLKHGVTTVVADPHEIANVLGIEGIETYMSNATTLDIFYGIPSSVPSTNSLLETTGGMIDSANVKQLLQNPKVLCLGEVMNFKDLTNPDYSLTRDIIKACHEHYFALPIEGHCPKISGLDLSRYIYYGVTADHTQQSPRSIVEKIKNGMFLEIQKKSMTKENIKTLVDHQFYEYFCLVTDDVMADHLSEGHLNLLVKLAYDLGMPIEKAIYCATYSPARRMHLFDRGAISPGLIADYILLDDLKQFKIHSVYKKGKCVYSKEEDVIVHENKSIFPTHFYHSINLKKAHENDFIINVPTKKNVVLCNVIEIESHSTFTHHCQIEVPVKNHQLMWQETDLALLCVFERYGKNHNCTFALVKGAIEAGAIATSWAHDHHNVMVMGRNIKDMVKAQHEIIDNQGGYVVVYNETIKAFAHLNVGGIVSDQPINVLSKQLKEVREQMQQLGYHHHNEIMSFSTLSLPVSPEIKVTDQGIIKTRTQEIIPLMELNDEN
ncbi:MAG: adenine deaminase C-terminal domain-containing protein [Beduini sp.]